MKKIFLQSVLDLGKMHKKDRENITEMHNIV